MLEVCFQLYYNIKEKKIYLTKNIFEIKPLLFY